jgi:SRSO17 transposase
MVVALTWIAGWCRSWRCSAARPAGPGPRSICGALLGPGERKSLQPMAARLGLGGHDQLQHFIASPAWDDGPLWSVLAQRGRPAGWRTGTAWLVIDDTALPKKGAMSVGVAPQYCGQLGKKANCQCLVSLTLAQGEVPVPVGLRLSLPQEWIGDPERCVRAGVPEAAMVPRSKGEIALEEIDRLHAAGVRFGTVLADAGYGASAAFRQGLDARGLLWAVGIPRNQKVYSAAVQLVPPQGRARKPVPNEEPREAEKVLAGLSWRRITWRQGTRGCAGRPVRRSAHPGGRRSRVGQQPAPARRRGLAGGRVALSGERKYYLSNLAPGTSLRALATAIKARWVCEQAHQQLKQELGLGHFEGRSWTGLHRHALMTCIACAYLQHLRLAEHRRMSRGKNADPNAGPATLAKSARRAARHPRPAVHPPRGARPMSALSAGSCRHHPKCPSSAST